MTMKKGRDLLLKISNGALYITLGAARVTKFSIANNPVDISTLNCKGYKELQADGGLQTTEIDLDGIFKDSAAEELLREAAFARSSKAYQLQFPNGDKIEGNFVISEYHREGSYNGLETFSLKLMSSGSNNYTEA